MIRRCTVCESEGKNSFIDTCPPLYYSKIVWCVCQKHYEILEGRYKEHADNRGEESIVGSVQGEEKAVVS